MSHQHSHPQSMAGKNFANADLAGKDFRGVELRGANFAGADLRGANLELADLAGAMSLNVDKVWLQSGDTEVLVPIGDVQLGDRILVRTGSLIPLDGQVVSGEAMVNQASITGESLPAIERQESSREMMEIALETALTVA